MSRDLWAICLAAAELAAGFPEPDPGDAQDPAEGASLHWNWAFARAVAGLARTAMKMCELRMLEVRLVTRAMMELCANQVVLNSDPKLAEVFSLQEQSSNATIVGMLEEYGTGESDEGTEKANQVAELAKELRGFGYEAFPDSFPPMEMNARKRFEIAGMTKYYDTFYALDSDFAHMNARAVHRYLDGDFSDEQVGHELILATDMLLRCLIAANERLRLGFGERIEGLVAEFKEAAS